MDIGDKIKKVRKAAGLTQEEFAKVLHVTGSYISEIEKGKKVPSDTLCDMVCMKFNVSKEFWDKGRGEVQRKQQDITLRLVFQELEDCIKSQPTEAESAIAAGELLKFVRSLRKS